MVKKVYPIKSSWRHGSIKSFLQKYKDGDQITGSLVIKHVIQYHVYLMICGIEDNNSFFKYGSIVKKYFIQIFCTIFFCRFSFCHFEVSVKKTDPSPLIFMTYPVCLIISGIEDNQMDCVLNVVCVVALYVGRPEMLDRVEEVITVTQNSDINLAVAFTAARWGLSILYSPLLRYHSVN